MPSQDWSRRKICGARFTVTLLLATDTTPLKKWRKPRRHLGWSILALQITSTASFRRTVLANGNPFVTMLEHPTGRLLLKREPYKIDVPEILDAAARTGTWIELNAAPKRLDLDWRWWPMAKQKGVKCVINPDAHRAERLQDLWFGIGIARKGWLTKDDVVNCLPLGKIEALLRAKRR